MTNKKFLMVILVMVPVLGMTVIGCGKKVDASLNGTWVSVTDGVDVEITLKNGNVESTTPGFGRSKGSYTTDNGKITMNYNNNFVDDENILGLESKWYSNNELILACKPILMGYGFSEEDFNKMIGLILNPPEMSYSVDDNSLILTTSYEGEISVMTLTKK